VSGEAETETLGVEEKKREKIQCTMEYPIGARNQPTCVVEKRHLEKK